MAYFKINNVDYSAYVNSLEIEKEANYNSQTNAAGDTVVDYINSKREVEVGIIPINDTIMAQLQTALDGFNLSVQFLNPETKQLETINCIIKKNKVEYYTIQAANVSFKEFKITFIEL